MSTSGQNPVGWSVDIGRSLDGKRHRIWNAVLELEGIILRLNVGAPNELGYPVSVRFWPSGNLPQVQTLLFYTPTPEEGRAEAEAVAILVARRWPHYLTQRPSESLEAIEKHKGITHAG